MYFNSTRPHRNLGAGLIMTQLNRQGANFDVTPYRCEDPSQVFDLSSSCLIDCVPKALAPALLAISMGSSIPAVTKFLSQAEVRLEDIDALPIWDDPDWYIATPTGLCLNAFELAVYLVQAMAACPIRAYVMERSLRSVQFSSTIIAALLHTENPELWTSTRLGAERRTLLPLLPINIVAPYSFTSVKLIPNANWADFLTRSGVLSLDYIRKAYGLSWFYETLLLHLATAGPEKASPILSHLEYLTEDQQSCFTTGLLNALFLSVNENVPKVRASELLILTEDKAKLLSTLKAVMSELIQDEWECQVLIAINYLPERYLKEPALIQNDLLYSILHESDSLLKRFCDEILEIRPEAFCLSDFVAMSHLAKLGRFSYDMTGIDIQKLFTHVVEGALYFLGSQCDYFCDPTSGKAAVDSLVLEGIKDFTFFFRSLEDKEFDLHLDFSELTPYDLLILRMADVNPRKMPRLPIFASEILERFWVEDAPPEVG